MFLAVRLLESLSNGYHTKFNRHVRHHMIHFPDIVVRPGGMTFGTGHSTTVPQSDRNRHFFAPEQLELKASINAKRVKLGQPLQVSWQIVNNSKVNIPLPNDVSIEAQHTYITIYDPNGHSKLMKSFVIKTDTVRMQELKSTLVTCYFWVLMVLHLKHQADM